MQTVPYNNYQLTKNFNFAKADKETILFTNKEYINFFYEAEQIYNKTLIIKLKRIVKNNPKELLLLHYLAIAYKNNAQMDLFKESMLTLQKIDPDYLFVKLWLAKKELDANNYDAFVKLLGPTLKLNELYPNRPIFHLDEMVSYETLVLKYLLKIKDTANAQEKLDAIVAVCDYNLEDEISEELEELESDKMANFDLFKEKLLPNFEHEEIYNLFKYSLENLTPQIVDAILKIPRKTLIKDLELLFITLFNNSKPFKKNKYWFKYKDVAIISFYILIDLKAHESLNTMLTFLKQSEDEVKFWFFDILEDDLSKYIYAIAKKADFGLIKEFVNNRKNNGYFRFNILEGLNHFVADKKEKQNEMFLINNEILEFYANLNYDLEDDFNEVEFINFFAQERYIVNNPKLFGYLKILFQKGFLSNYYMGSYNGIEEEVNKGIYDYVNAVENLETNLYKLLLQFENVNFKGLKNKNEQNNDDDFDNQDFGDDEFICIGNNDFSEDFEKLNYAKDDVAKSNFFKQVATPFVAAEPKTGRNEPCPCGSGNKFKKCCGKG